MSLQGDVSGRAEAVRQKTLATLKALAEAGKALGLPQPPPGLERCRAKLEENAYQVLVVGEAKRGKSTFVNALIGRDVLPTDVDVATCQVFRVRPAEREAYRLRFEDGSEQAITAADLPRYGSQAVADREGPPRPGRLIRWVEADVPARFLPPNVRLLDTPGLGALYAAHAQITHRFLPHADAVVFVLDSHAPVGEPEAQLVEQLLDVTGDLFFIQTKIDQVRREAWQEVQRRNEEVLRQRFPGRLAEARVWPVSSTNLRKAAQTGDEDYLLVSRHRELATALRAFLFRVAGWGRSAEAVVLAGRHQAQSRNVLAARLDDLLEESKRKRAESQQRAAGRRREFEADWGGQGQKRRELLERLQGVSALGKQRIRQALQPRGELGAKYRAKVEALSSTTEAVSLAQRLPSEVIAAALSLWREAREVAEPKYAELLAPFAVAAEGVTAGPEQDVSLAGIGTQTAPLSRQSGTEKFLTSLRNAVFAGTAAHFLVGPAVAAAAPFWVVPAVAFFAVGVPTVIVAQRAQLKNAKQDLLRYLCELLEQVHHRFLTEVDLASGRSSVVDEYFNSRQRALADQVASLAAQKLAEAQAEISRLAEQSGLDDRERRARAEAVQRQLADWDRLGHSLQEIRAELQELERTLAPAPAAV